MSVSKAQGKSLKVAMHSLVDRTFEKGVLIHEISIMYHHLVVIHPLLLILLPNESLVLMLFNDMLHDMFKYVTFSNIISKYHKKFHKIWLKKNGHA